MMIATDIFLKLKTKLTLGKYKILKMNILGSKSLSSRDGSRQRSYLYLTRWSGFRPKLLRLAKKWNYGLRQKATSWPGLAPRRTTRSKATTFTFWSSLRTSSQRKTMINRARYSHRVDSRVVLTDKLIT